MAVAETVGLKALLKLQAKHMKLSHQAAKLVETVDFLLESMTAYIYYSAPRRMEQNSCLIASMNLCSIRLTQPQQKDGDSFLVLVGATGINGRTLDIAQALEETTSH